MESNRHDLEKCKIIFHAWKNAENQVCENCEFQVFIQRL